MHNYPEQRTRYLVSALYRYTQSLESGDLAGVADILRRAEQDPVLERLLLEINEVYQEADASPVSPAELAHVQDFLTPLLVEQETNLKVNGTGPQVEQKLMLSGWQHDSQERRPEIMKDSINTAPTAEDSPLQDDSNRPAHLPVRKRRLTHFMQMLAATLVVGALLAGFLTLLGSRHPGMPGTSDGPVSNASSVVALNSSGGTVYALRPLDGTVLWQYATGIVDTTVGSDTSLAVLNHVVYFAVRGRVFAFQDMTGKLLWQQDVLSASAHVFGSTTYTFAQDGNILLVHLANNYGEGANVLFALHATTGSILWQYDMNFENLMIASHGIVYITTSDASGSNGMLRALRVTDGKELWNYNKPITVVNILAIGKVLYLQADVYLPPVSNYANVQESLIALNALTGAFMWSKPLQNTNLEVMGGDMGLILSENGGPVLYNGYQFCDYGSDGAQLWCSHDFAPRQAHTGALIPNFYAPAGQVLATLRIVIGKTSFYLKLEALSLKTGKTLWDAIPTFTKGTHSHVSEGYIGALISGDSKTIYAVAGLDVYAYNASNGQILWHIVKHVTGFPGNDGITGLAVG